MMSNLCTPWGEVKFFPTPLESGAWYKLFMAILEKEYPKLVLKFWGLPRKKNLRGSKLAKISWFSDFFAHFSKTVRHINNLKTDFKSVDIRLPDGKEMVCFSLRSTTNYVIQARKHPPSDLTAGLYTKRLARGRLWAEVFQFDARSVKIISSFVIFWIASVTFHVQ